MGAGRSTVSVPFSGFHAHFVLWFAGYAQRTFTCSLPRRKSTGSVQRPSRRATSPHGDVRLVRGFKAQRDPCVCKVRRTERPERQRALDVAADRLVIIERFLDEREVFLGNFRKVTALVNALHQRIAHIKYGFLASAALHRVAPNGALLRRQTRGRVRRNGRIAQVVLLVARRLNAVAREHRVVDAHAAEEQFSITRSG